MIGIGSLGYNDLDETIELPAINRLKKDALHQISRPVQVSTYEDTNNDGLESSNELLSVQRINFKDWGNNIVLPKDIQIHKGIYEPTDVLENRVIYHKYDNKGNPLEISKNDGVHTYTIWGYNETLPIAKLENFDSAHMTSTLQSLINVAITTSDNDISSASEDTLRNALNNIRNASLLSGALVTTFTHNPQVGVTSITNPRGYTIYYEYDNFNRLKAVKDADGNVISDNQYHYKNQ